jgi:hypothetical protein
MKMKCPCCEYSTIDQIGTYEICPVCFWEDDPIQSSDPNYSGGANSLSLNESKLNFKIFGAVDKKFVEKTRPPTENER